MSNVITLATVCLIVSVIAQGSSCGSSSSNGRTSNSNADMRTPITNHKLPVGVWGGQHVRADVAVGGAEFEFDCAHGTIGQAIMLDESGKFDVPGRFATEHAGPVRDEERNDRSVRYSGSVKDEEMTLTITDPNTKEVIGTFTLRHGSEGRLMKCR